MTDWKPAMRVPDPAVRVLDKRFRPYVLPLAKLERLATGCRWAEGPVWFGDHRTLVWSDIPNDRMLRWDAANETLSVFRQPSNYANGNTWDQQGRLVTCEHGESVLYVVESRAVLHRRIVAYDVRDGSLGEQRPFIDCGDGTPDGLRIDEDGNLWCGWGGGEGLDGVRVFAPDSTPIGHIDLPERCANLAFGGRACNRLFLAAHSSLYALYVNVRGVR